MRALAFDPSSKCGWAAWDGEAPAPQLDRHTVAYWGSDDGAMLERFRLWLGGMIKEHNPQIIAIEAPAAGIHGDLSTMNRQAKIAGMIEWAAHVKQLPCYHISPGTWRKTFIGFGARGKRTEKIDWKALACARCDALGWAYRDHNAAEAAAILDHVLHVERGILTPWRQNAQHWLSLPEINNGK